MKLKPLHIAGLILIAAAIVAIVLSSQDYTTYADFATAQKQSGKEFHIVGEFVRDREAVYEPAKNANYFSFYLKDEKGEIRKVEYYKARPQDFEKSEKIVCIGKMDNGNFRASEILMKCPSKYVDKEIKLKEANNK